MLRSAPTSRSSIQLRRQLRLESLEGRCMLSHPAVAAVNVAGTGWASNFVSNLETLGLGVGGYAIPVGGSAQLQTLPWTNIDQIRITFSEDVTIAIGDLSVSGVNTTAYAFSNFSYDPNTFTAVWTLAAPITKDKLLLDLDADGMAPVLSVSTQQTLDGAWTDCQSSYPSGNGQGGTDFQFRVNVLPGDVNASNGTNIVDSVTVNQKVGKNIGDAGYDVRCDVNGSGGITSSDVSSVQSKVGSMLPSGNPAGMTNDAPTTSGIPDASVAATVTDQVLTLTDFFADAETPSSQLTYSVTQNTNPSLFSSLNINSGQLDLNFASGICGDADLTIRATDAGGLFTQTTVKVHRSDAPYISNFYCINEYGNIWTFTGTVTDYDDDVEGYVITLGGALESYHLAATVESDGVFCLTVELIGLEAGTATAQTKDPHGVVSNLAMDWICV